MSLPPAARRPSLLARAFILPVQGYRRWISPLLPPRCRFHPTCSAYALEAVRTHGALSGGRRALWRVLRCQPFSAGGVDPVPPRRTRHATADATKTIVTPIRESPRAPA